MLPIPPNLQGLGGLSRRHTRRGEQSTARYSISLILLVLQRSKTQSLLGRPTSYSEWLEWLEFLAKSPRLGTLPTSGGFWPGIMALVLGQKWPPDPTAEKAVERIGGEKYCHITDSYCALVRPDFQD